MKQHRFSKRMISAGLSGAMLLSCAALPVSAAGISIRYGLEGCTLPYTTQINTNFDNGVGLPWHTAENAPAKLSFDISDGTYNVRILNNGSVAEGGIGRFGCQFRHKRLSFVQGTRYHVHAEVTSDQDGEIFTRIGTQTGAVDIWHNSMGATKDAVGYEGTETVEQSWECIKMEAGKTLVIDAEFLCNSDIESGEWSFQFGGQNEFQPVDCFPDGTVLKFDNLQLYEADTEPYAPFSAGLVYDPYPVAVNQVGYFWDEPKTAVLHYADADFKAKNVYLMNAETGEVVFQIPLDSKIMDDNSGRYTHVLDFSDFMLLGSYYFSLDGQKSVDSCTFQIGDDIYAGAMKDAVNYFYQNRAGMAVKEEYITSKGSNEKKADLAHDKYGHSSDTGYIQNEWVKAYSQTGDDVNTQIGKLTANGGWYDAENFTKSVINGANALWMLQNMVERTEQVGNAGRFSETADDVVTPEHGNKIPDILDECKYELDFLLSMTVPESLTKYELKHAPGLSNEASKDTKKYAGMLFHAIQDSAWTGLAVRSWEYIDDGEYSGIKRIVKPPTTMATLAGAAVFAQAARLFEQYDAEYAKTLLDAAKAAFAAAKANPNLYPAYEAAVSSRSTGDNDCTDDFYWAACELYVTTGDKTYLKELEAAGDHAYALSSILTGGENNYSNTSFNWGNTAGYGSLTLSLHKDLLSKKNAESLEQSITAAADQYLKFEQAGAFGVPYVKAQVEDSISIPLGSSAFVGYENESNGMITNNAVVLAYAYDLTKDDKYLSGAEKAMDYIFGCNPLDTSYVTGYGERAVQNPIHRYWAYELDKWFPSAPNGVMVSGANSALNDPLVKALGMDKRELAPQLCYLDDIEAWSVNSCGLTLNASLAWMMGFLSEDAQPTLQYETGDVNGDTHINVADAVMLCKYLTTAEKLTKAQLAAADLNGDKQVNAVDLTLLKRALIVEPNKSKPDSE